MFFIILILLYNVFPENDSLSMQNQQQSENGSTTGKTYISNEMFDGKMVGSFK